jgi:c-di-GMP-binding flagellar brake protein YcgR
MRNINFIGRFLHITSKASYRRVGLMEKIKIAIGTRLEMKILDSYAEKSDNLYISQLLEHGKNNTLIISTPIHEARLVYVPMDGLIRLFFLYQDLGLVTFTAKVTYKGTRGNISIIGIVPVSDFEKIQRRKYYRLDCLLKAEYTFLDEDGGTSEEIWKNAVCKNISASGACFVIEEQFPRGKVIKCRITLNDTTGIAAIAVVLRIEKLENSTRRFEHGLYFKEISESDQNKLIKFIFEQQRLLLSKAKF